MGLTLIVESLFAAPPFYERKTIRIIVGTTAGGSFDAYARVIARHMGRYIPGNPAFIVDNMPGAGGLACANHLYRVAKPDGLTMGIFNGGLFYNQVLGLPGVEFDARKFVHIGVPMKDVVVSLLSKASGINSVEKWMASKRPLKFGTTAPGAGNHNAVVITREALGLPTQVVSGYKGVTDIRLAFESGEVDGLMVGWDTAKPVYSEAVESGNVFAVFQLAGKPLSDIPKVPLAINFARTDGARQLIEAGIHSQSLFSRPFVLPPGAPKEQAQILRKAFSEVLADKELLSETKKAQMTIDPSTSDEVEEVIDRLFKIDPAVLAKLKEIIFK